MGTENTSPTSANLCKCSLAVNYVTEKVNARTNDQQSVVAGGGAPQACAHGGVCTQRRAHTHLGASLILWGGWDR